MVENVDFQSLKLIDNLLNKINNYYQQSDENKIHEEIQNINTILQLNNPLHMTIIKKINTYTMNLSNKDAQIENNPSKKRIKYKSKIDVEDLDSIVNMSLWKNIPNVNTLFPNFEKKNSLMKNQVKNYGLNNNNFNNKKLAESDEEGVQHNTYMSNSYYLKRKNNSNVEYENYSNSIYNVNKKKGKSKWNKNNRTDEDIDEPILEEEELGFKSAINMINKKVFKNSQSNYGNSIHNNEKDEEEKNNSNLKNSNNQNNTYNPRKFNPPYKGGSTSNNSNGSTYNNVSNKKIVEEEKEKELDEKLKGFDRKMIEFIESEILSFSPNVKWEDIAGLEFAKKTIKEIIIWPLLRPDLFNGIRQPPKGLLLFGPPGTGKTMIAKAIASESHSKFFNISASSLMSKWIGESEKLVRTLFALASFYQPSVVFIDEIDSILTARTENECEASRRLKTEFLIQLDGAGTNQQDRILIIGATNRPQEIDDAFIRRLAKRLYIPLPNATSRTQLIKNIVEKEKSQYEINEDSINSIVSKTKGYSGSDMMYVIKEAAMMPIRNIEDIYNIQLSNLRKVNSKDFYDAIDIVKPSVSDKTISQYVQWNKDFGSFQFEEKDSEN